MIKNLSGTLIYSDPINSQVDIYKIDGTDDILVISWDHEEKLEEDKEEEQEEEQEEEVFPVPDGVKKSGPMSEGELEYAKQRYNGGETITEIAKELGRTYQGTYQQIRKQDWYW